MGIIIETVRFTSGLNATRLRIQNSDYAELYHNLLTTTGDAFLLLDKVGVSGI